MLKLINIIKLGISRAIVDRSMRSEPGRPFAKQRVSSTLQMVLGGRGCFAELGPPEQGMGVRISQAAHTKLFMLLNACVNQPLLLRVICFALITANGLEGAGATLRNVTSRRAKNHWEVVLPPRKNTIVM